MTRRKLLFPVTFWLLCLAGSGCAPKDTFRPVALDGPASGYLAVADATAQKSIDWWNAHGSPEHAWSLQLGDYQRTAEIGCWEEYRRWCLFRVEGEHRPVLKVYYHLVNAGKNSLHVLDGPNDFSIWVYLDTGQAMAI